VAPRYQQKLDCRMQAQGFSRNDLHRILSPLAAGRRLWIAFSGGLDSSVLLHATAALRTQLQCELRAVHLDHGLHPRSSAWSAHCAAVCTGLDIPLTTAHLRLDPGAGESVEAVARAARYQRFSELLGPGDLLATAQHRDDQAETLLLALLRGSGVHGLAAMPSTAPLGHGMLVRPLLGFSRSALAEHARRAGIVWIEDPSNADAGFDRNRLRHQVLPALRERWPSFDRTLARSAAQCAEAAELLDGVADQWIAGLMGSRPHTLSIDGLRALPRPRCRLVLRRWLHREGFLLPSRATLERVIDELLQAACDRTPLIAWRGCEVRRYRRDLYALAPLPPTPQQTLRWSGDQPLRLPNGLGRLELDTKPSGLPVLHVCFGRAGLRCRVGDAPSRTLKKLYQEAGVPAWLRAYVPLLLLGSELAAVAGVSQCDARLAGLRWCAHPWVRYGLVRRSVPADA
jgi:tRNA(Ile)-lysidine synthase